MEEFTGFSIELTEPERDSIIIDYDTFSIAFSKATRLSGANDNFMVTLIEWDRSRRQVHNEWLIRPNERPLPFKHSACLH